MSSIPPTFRHSLRLWWLAIVMWPVPLLAAAPRTADVLTQYADIALATYEDSLEGARALSQAIEGLVATPNEPHLQAAREAWRQARVPYMQSEAFRFGNPVVDAWEGRVNAWPLDEGLIDYVDASYGTESDANAWYAANMIANTQLHVGGREIDATRITPQLLSESLHEIGGIEANVASGYHAVEFLLWGQDLNGTGAGAGTRPATDFDPAHCTGGHCQRRVDYLRAAMALLIDDLEEMVGDWRADGAARRHIVANGADAGLTSMLTGLGSLSYGELAGERMKLGLMLNDPEEEHDCFSDNTHNSHYYNQVGILNVYEGRYVRTGGATVQGPSLSDLVKAKDPALDAELRGALHASRDKLAALKHRAETVEAYDQMIGRGNAEGNAVVQAAIDSLIAQTRSIERAVAALAVGGVHIEGSDSLDAPDEVFK